VKPSRAFPSDGKGQKTVSPDQTHTDRDLWHKVAAGIKPLKGRSRPQLPAPSDPYDIPVTKLLATPARPKVPLKTLSTQHAEDVDASTLQKFRAGKMPIAGRIDLHGMTQLEAHGALLRFIQFSYHNGRRCVLVITGRSGVLHKEAPRWLNEEALRPHILALAPAKSHGGSGALYVLLKRRR
jgi:DNA-nicking Smr family endonuclease